MQYNILDYLEKSSQLYPNKDAIIDEYRHLTYQELLDSSKTIGSSLIKIINPNQPIAVYMEKSIEVITSFLGITYAGGYYTFLNTELPEKRLLQITSILKPTIIITTKSLQLNAKEIFSNIPVVTIDTLLGDNSDHTFLDFIATKKIDTDPLYINFTSGSTGKPKGIVVSHRSVIDFIDCFVDIFDITSQDIIANQAPFDFDVSVKDIYSCLKTGATLVIVPRRLFSSPVELIDYLCAHNVTTMIWAVSALSLISTFHALDYKTPQTINKILFSGEIMPYKTLIDFKKHLPDAVYVNLYGPTEITCNCCYHVLDKERDYTKGIPIGKSFPNEDVFLLDENNQLIQETDKTGEICVRGSTLALGYFDAPSQNDKYFTQNPLNPYYPETIYRTGDLGKYDENNDLLFSGRKDFQVKYMGHRIELEEIEHEIEMMDGVDRCCCIFDEKKSRLKGFYIGNIEKQRLYHLLKEKLPIFMIPGILRKMDQMPLNKNGKIDRKKLSDMNGGK